MTVEWPTWRDVSEARRSLLRLHAVYTYHAHDMFHGNYAGHVGKPLSTEDAYLVSRDVTGKVYLVKAYCSQIDVVNMKYILILRCYHGLKGDGIIISLQSM